MSVRLAVASSSIALFLAFAPNGWADEIHVPSDHPTIQAAIEAAQPGDEVIVAPGVFHERINLLGKAITVRSLAGPARTAIDGGGADVVVRCVSGESRNSVLQGFTLQGGISEAGGGLRIDNSSPAVLDCVFFGNESTSWGGGGALIRNGEPLFRDCTFQGNTAANGGAILTRGTGTLTIERSAFIDNIASQTGGALSSQVATHITITDSLFIRNEAAHGGALNVLEAEVRLERCDFTANRSLVEFGRAGAVELTLGSGRFIECRFMRSQAQFGAAAVITVPIDDVVIDDCSFEASIAIEESAAIHVFTAEGAAAVIVSDTHFCANDSDDINGDVIDGGGNTFSDACAGPAASPLTGVRAEVGAIREGGLLQIVLSDDSRLAARSGFGATFIDLHHLDLRVAAATTVTNPSLIDLAVESRIDQPAGTLQLRLRNWTTDQFTTVGSFAIGATASSTATARSNSRSSPSCSCRSFAFRFDTFVDHVGITVE